MGGKVSHVHTPHPYFWQISLTHRLVCIPHFLDKRFPFRGVVQAGKGLAPAGVGSICPAAVYGLGEIIQGFSRISCQTPGLGCLIIEETGKDYTW